MRAGDEKASSEGQQQQPSVSTNETVSKAGISKTLIAYGGEHGGLEVRLGEEKEGDGNLVRFLHDLERFQGALRVQSFVAFVRLTVSLLGM